MSTKSRNVQNFCVRNTKVPSYDGDYVYCCQRPESHETQCVCHDVSILLVTYIRCGFMPNKRYFDECADIQNVRLG